MFCKNVCSSISQQEYNQSMNTACAAASPRIKAILGCNDQNYNCKKMCTEMGKKLKNWDEINQITSEFCNNNTLKDEELRMVSKFCDVHQKEYEAMCESVKNIKVDCLGYVQTAIAAYNNV